MHLKIHNIVCYELAYVCLHVQTQTSLDVLGHKPFTFEVCVTVLVTGELRGTVVELTEGKKVFFNSTVLQYAEDCSECMFSVPHQTWLCSSACRRDRSLSSH